MKAKKKNGVVEHTGSTFDSFLEEEGIREEVEAVAVKRVISWQLAEAMRKKKKTGTRKKNLIRAALSLIVCLIHRISPFHWTRFPALPERSAKD
jgi:hypothetical protein